MKITPAIARSVAEKGLTRLCRSGLGQVLACWMSLATCFVAAGQTSAPQAGPNPPVPKYGGTLRLAAPFDVKSLDPTTIYTWLEGILAMMLYSPLLDLDENGNVVPGLAEALPTISADKRTYTFRLRPGVRFSNGREVMAADVVYSLERHLDPRFQSSWGNYYHGIVGADAFTQARSNELAVASSAKPGMSRRRIEPTTVSGLRAVDPHTLEIQLNEPDLMFPQIMATPYSVVVPREEVERWDDRFGSHPVGSGPFVLKEWNRGVRVRLERNPLYYLAPQPYLDAVEVMVNVDNSTQLMMFDRGEIDYVIDVPGCDLIRLKRNPRYARCIESVVGVHPIYVSLNCEMPPFTNPQVRLAMNYAVNKVRILKLLQGEGVVARGVLPPTVKGFNPDLPGYPYSLDTASNLLAEAGMAKGFTVPFWTDQDPGSVQIALAVKQDLAAVGVTVQLNVVSATALLDGGQRRKRVPMALWDWLANFDDPKDTLDFLVNGERIVEEGCLNCAFYSNTNVNRLFREAAPKREPDERLRLYQQLERTVVEEAPWIFLFNLNRHTLHQESLKGYKIRSIWPERLENVWLEK